MQTAITLPDPIEIPGHDEDGQPETTTIEFRACDDGIMLIAVTNGQDGLDVETVETAAEAVQQARQWAREIARQYKQDERSRRLERLAEAKAALIEASAELSDDVSRAVIALADLIGRGRASAAYESLRWLKQH